MFKTIFDSMEAPEKIFLFENPIDGEPDYRWLSKRNSENDIEYIRKDTLIEELVKFLDKDYLIKTKCPPRWVPVKKVIEDFKNYIK